MTTNFTRKLTIASLALAGMATSFAALSAPTAAYADTTSRTGVGILKSQDGGDTWATGTYSKTLTFTLSTTTPNTAEVDDLAAGQESADARRGNVEFEWKVEEGESGATREISGLKMEQDVIEAGDDINIGVGELQECTISKSMDRTTVPIAQFADSESPRDPAMEYGKDGAKGGNVEFEWKVEEGES